MTHQGDRTSRRQREAFRVPIPQPTDLRAELFLNQQLIPGTATDLSLTGVRFHISSAYGSLFEPSTRVIVKLRLGHDEVIAAGVVLRISHFCVAIEFPDYVGHPDPNPPAGLSRIVMALQRELLHRAISLPPLQ